ncbi:UNVERIFIED_CONTAM: hypothetical protein Slati_3862500 [Sesamum latifolium]|uniref:Uncharacterized protein n=1 Tax=Sesamum latifolium TaxID=2727402 RepID=A0AAW2TL48_9LAMI
MDEGSSVHGHGIEMLYLVEKLEDFKAGLNNDTNIDVILQSLLPSYDPFIINYNMNGLEKSINELINMLVQYEATTPKSTSAVLVGEASTSKAKGKRAGHWKRKKGKRKTVAATASATGALAALVGKGKGKGKIGGSQRSRANDVCMHCQGKGIGRGSAHNSSPTHYDYVYLMRYKSEAFERFKEYRLEIFLEKGFPANSRRDEVLVEETSVALQQNDATSFEPMVSTNSVLVFRRSTRESRPPGRHGFLGLTNQLDNDPRTYGEAMSDINSDKWLEAMRSEMDSIGSNRFGPRRPT